MAKPRRPDPQRTLPGLAAAPASRDETPVTIPMAEVTRGTDKAWHLAPLGVGSAKAAWVARSICTRGVGSQASQFTMPKWAARENGWLR